MIIDWTNDRFIITKKKNLTNSIIIMNNPFIDQSILEPTVVVATTATTINMDKVYTDFEQEVTTLPS